jgi:peptide/nickel transport system substrate-binding protein
MRKLDERTVRFELDKPFALVNEFLGTAIQGAILPVGFDPRRPVGTGPFKLQKFAPGRETTLVPFANYFGGAPLVDELRLVEFSDDASITNAFLGGQIDAIESVPIASRTVVKGTSGRQLFVQRTNAARLIEMRVDVAPFSDVRVRQAMRLLADRDQLLANAAGGYGTVANDLLVGPDDPGYPKDISQRQQDIEQAKSLLAKAGQSDLSVQLVTTAASSGQVEQAQLLAQQARAAGVTIDVKNVPTGTYYGKDYLTYPFSTDYHNGGIFWRVANYFEAPTASYNATHWKDPEWTGLWNEAVRTVDVPKRNGLVQDMQRIDWERGGLLIWGYLDQIGGISDKVTGMAPQDGVSGPLNAYNFRRVGVA